MLLCKYLFAIHDVQFDVEIEQVLQGVKQAIHWLLIWINGYGHDLTHVLE